MHVWAVVLVVATSVGHDRRLFFGNSKNGNRKSGRATSMPHNGDFRARFRIKLSPLQQQQQKPSSATNTIIDTITNALEAAVTDVFNVGTAPSAGNNETGNGVAAEASFDVIVHPQWAPLGAKRFRVSCTTIKSTSEASLFRS
jgi:hypothetical protein